MLAESLDSSGTDGRIQLSAQTVPPKTQYWHSILPCTAEMTSSIYKSIWVRLLRVWGGTGLVLGILAMAP